jgi:hypothetical protein
MTQGSLTSQARRRHNLGLSASTALEGPGLGATDAVAVRAERLT